MKKKRYCAKRHLNSRQVMLQFLYGITRFQENVFHGEVRLSSMDLNAKLCRVAIRPDALAYSPRKGWVFAKDCGFSGECTAWITDFSLSLCKISGGFYAVYKLKTGERLLLFQTDVVVKEYFPPKFWIGRHCFVMDMKGNYTER